MSTRAAAGWALISWGGLGDRHHLRDTCHVSGPVVLITYPEVSGYAQVLHG